MALAGVLAAGWPSYVKCLVVLLIATSLWRSRPPRTTAVIVTASGEWALPEESLYQLRLMPGTQYTRVWGLLRFVAADGRRHDLPVWSDTLSQEDWRRLSIRLREHR